RVINKGFIIEDQEWKEAEGKAYFVEDENTGYLKVSFFGPFYGAYVIFELDNNYQYAFVTSNNKEYLWFLSRSPTVDQGLMGYFVRQAKLQGFDTDKLIWVEQNTD
ncbi:MAG: lipocalin family protein, partial [Gammaproteobacteria bacterium]|nr:lipocalin family protein [Gammaproteobacteria bacterium]